MLLLVPKKLESKFADDDLSVKSKALASPAMERASRPGRELRDRPLWLYEKSPRLLSPSMSSSLTAAKGSLCIAVGRSEEEMAEEGSFLSCAGESLEELCEDSDADDAAELGSWGTERYGRDWLEVCVWDWVGF